MPLVLSFGQLLTALVGYNGNPSLVEMSAYFVYLVITLGFYPRPSIFKKEMSVKVKASSAQL